MVPDFHGTAKTYTRSGIHRPGYTIKSYDGIVHLGMVVALECAMAIEVLVIIVVLIAMVDQALISTKLLLDVVKLIVMY